MRLCPRQNEKECAAMTTAQNRQPETMTDVIGMYIKDLITAYPAIGETLSRAGIGCVTCSVGTCLLKDVVSIHNLTEEQEQKLFGAIAAVVFPGRTMVLPCSERKLAVPAAARLVPPVQDMVNEHTRIKRVLAVLPALADRLGRGLDASARAAVTATIDFVRQYADRYHHAKEEDVLFKFFDAQLDVLSVMYKEHEIGRGHVRAAAAALEQGDVAGIVEHLQAYGALLREHIRKEDEILYPWMSRELTDSQVGHLFAACRKVDEEFDGKDRYYLSVVEELEKGFAPERIG